MEKQIIYLATNDEDDARIAFEDKQACIDHCTKYDWSWSVLSLIKKKSDE